MTTRIHHQTYDLRSTQVGKVRDALEGAETVEQQGQTYLPKPDGMSSTQYEAYLKRAHWFPVAERTLRGWTGVALNHRPQIELPSRLVPMIEAATYRGHSLDVMVEQVLSEVLSTGHVALLLDFPTSGATSTTTPYVSVFEAQACLDYREELVDGRAKLTYVRLQEDAYDDLDNEIERHLVLTLAEGVYTVERFERVGQDWVQFGETIVPTVGGKPLTEIPVVFIGPYELRAEPPKPPLLDLVNVALSHYRNSADLEHALFLTSQPTPWVAGNLNAEQRPSTIGSGAVWFLPDGASCGMLEMTGHGIQHLRDVMATKKEEMAALGARAIYEGQNRNEASDTARMRGRAETSLLGSAVRMTEAGIRRILQMAAVWVGANPADVTFEMSKDFVSAEMGANELTALVKAWQSGAISHQTLVENLKRGEIVPPDRSFEDEKDMIEAEGGDTSTFLTRFPGVAAE